MTQLLLKTSNLGCEVAGQVLFKDLNLEIKSGELLKIDGPNGCGKSTLLRCLVGIKLASSGSVERFEKCTFLGHKIGLNPLLTVSENIQFSRAMAESSEHSIEVALERLDLYSYRNHLVGKLSAGLKQRCALARIWVQACKIWLLDEPRSALDAQSKELLNRLIIDHREEGGCIGMVSHTPVSFDDVQTLGLGL